ncbi:hypothetical protein HPC49_00315 [Pyxidicoccus fallax]|uniref:Uncharacterized protein n=1 Tax=Pyxidicoccus fallax TaxID=394095 RepID=A0A848L4S4_9BACT|nr:hypothetical protein [Pyxidicoccus fallax]NMO13970.1 hypothetical protein [Pyxidicoccus fallax]NPC76698.1 hypothetical protein [Pyxidicoccus fallax]
MIHIDLVSLGQRAAETVPSLLRRIDLKGGDRDPTLRQFQELCLNLHTLAAASLLVDGEPRAFREELHNAASQWLRFLQHQHAQHWEPPPASRNTAFLGAVLAGHWELAQRLAELTTNQWRRGEEYEDDACWAILLHEFVLTQGRGNARIEALLARLDELGGTLNGDRVAWARALLEQKVGALSDAFSGLLQLHQEEIEERVLAVTASEVKLAPYRFLWFEGLALLRLGARAGIAIPDGYYPYCPPLARLPLERTGATA